MSTIDRMNEYLELISRHKTATYRNGKVDFTRAEGGNNHIYVYDPDGNEIGYIWFDTHCGTKLPTFSWEKLGFCGKTQSSCNGIFTDIIQEWFKYQWVASDNLFYISAEQFVHIMDELIKKLH